MTKDEMNAAATKFVADVVAKHNGGRVKLGLEPDASVVLHWSVENGNTRGLPVIGSHELSRLGDELDVESGHLTVTFHLVGEINGKQIESNTRVWIDRTLEVSKRSTLTDKAAAIVYDIAREVRAGLVENDTLGLHRAAQGFHLENLARRVHERIDYLEAVLVRANAGVVARSV